MTKFLFTHFLSLQNIPPAYGTLSQDARISQHFHRTPTKMNKYQKEKNAAVNSKNIRRTVISDDSESIDRILANCDYKLFSPSLNITGV